MVTWLSQSSPDNEVAVFFFELGKDDYLKQRYYTGIEDHILDPMPAIHLCDDRPASNALREMKMLAYSEADLKAQNKKLVILKENLSPRNQNIVNWRSAVVIPIGTHRGYSLLFTHDITKIEDYVVGLRTFEALLNLYEASLAEPLPTMQPKEKFGEKLTARQETIFEQIKLAKTNMQIALALGYSESLIRQETMTIYKKLGVSGRKEIQAIGV